jgi:ubiquinone/menaquinone biosynthesis C-methylase UbiE
MSYLMESSREGRRLQEQENANPSSLRLIQAGLRRGQRVVDIGCGSGAVMPAILDLVGADGSVTGVDASEERVLEARKLVAGTRNAIAQVGALPATGLPDASFDFSWSQFVFEYLREPQRALDEMIRVTRPGGTVAVADVDGIGLAFWPRPAVVEEGLPHLMRALESTGFDFFVGRKLFTWFKQAGLHDVRVHLSSLYVSAGADERLHADYTQRFEVLAPIAVKTFGDEQRYWEFAKAYLALLADPDALKYAVVLTVAGRRQQ